MSHDNTRRCARDILRALDDERSVGVAETRVSNLLRTLHAWRLAEVRDALDYLASHRWIEHDACLHCAPDDDEPVDVCYAEVVRLSALAREEGTQLRLRHEQCRAAVLGAIKHLPRIKQTDPDFEPWLCTFRVDDLCAALPTWDRADLTEALDRLAGERLAFHDYQGDYGSAVFAYSFSVSDEALGSERNRRPPAAFQPRAAGKAVTR